MRLHVTKFVVLAILAMLVPIMQETAISGGIDGWEVGSEYDQLYNPKERDQINGDIVKFITVSHYQECLQAPL